jgi:hypothetical protein
MNNWLVRSERAFEAWGHWVIRRAWITVVGALALVLALASQIPSIQVDTSIEGFFQQDDPALVAYNRFKEQFGNDSVVVVMIRPDEMFSEKTLQQLRDYHEALEAELPYLDEVQSLVNVTSTRGEDDRLIVEELMDPFPEDEAARAAFRQRALENPFYRNQLVSEDGKLMALIARPVAWVGPQASGEDDLLGFDSDSEEGAETEQEIGVDSSSEEGTHILSHEEKVKFAQAIAEVSQRFSSANFRIYEGGTIVMERVILEEMLANMPRFTAMAIGLIAVLLFAVFRRVVGVVLPLLTVILSLLGTIGGMSTFGEPVTIVSQILPSFLLAVSVGYAVHLLAIFFQHFNRNGDKHAAIVHALGHSGLAILITSLTTAGGLLSFSGAPMAPIAGLGRFGAFGVLMAVFLTLTLLPALLSRLPIKPKAQLDSQQPSRSERLLDGIGQFAVRRPWLVLGVSALLAVGAFSLATGLHFSHNPVAWLPEDSEVRISSDAINAEMKGAVIAELVVDTGTENGVKAPEVMAALERFNREAETLEVGLVAMGKSTSIADMLKQIHQALNENRPEFYAIPEDAELIAQELLLFENSGGDDLERMTDVGYTQARVTMKMPWIDANAYVPMLAAIEELAREIFGSEVELELTGLLTLLARTIDLMMVSMAESYLIAATVITVLMMIVLGSWKLGLWSMIPNFLPILLGLGLMRLLNLPLDAMSILVGSIALGLAVDDTIHFLHNFRRYHAQTSDVAESVRLTLTTTGRAMLFTTVVLSCGFYTYLISDMSNLFSFGLITGTTIIFALLADLLLAPALMTLLYRKPQPSSQKIP